MLLRVLVACKLEVIRNVKLRLGITFQGLKVNNKRILDSKDGIVL